MSIKFWIQIKKTKNSFRGFPPAFWHLFPVSRLDGVMLWWRKSFSNDFEDIMVRNFFPFMNIRLQIYFCAHCYWYRALNVGKCSKDTYKTNCWKLDKNRFFHLEKLGAGDLKTDSWFLNVWWIDLIFKTLFYLLGT